jgi:hypothetical protein
MEQFPSKFSGRKKFFMIPMQGVAVSNFGGNRRIARLFNQQIVAATPHSGAAAVSC